MTNDAIVRYDAGKAPKPRLWLDLDEDERMTLVEAYHHRAHLEIPRARAHAMIHVIVENQIALKEEPVIGAMVRLRSEGLSRHDALHAIGNVLLMHLDALMSNPDGADSAAALEATATYYMQLDNLTAKAWLNQTL